MRLAAAQNSRAFSEWSLSLLVQVHTRLADLYACEAAAGMHSADLILRLGGALGVAVAAPSDGLSLRVESPRTESSQERAQRHATEANRLLQRLSERGEKDMRDTRAAELHAAQSALSRVRRARRLWHAARDAAH